MSHDPTAGGTAPTAEHPLSTHPAHTKRMVIAPLYRQAVIFVARMGWTMRNTVIVTRPDRLHGYRLDRWEVWWLDGLWPCRTREDVDRMNEMMIYARARGADIRRWYT